MARIDETGNVALDDTGRAVACWTGIPGQRMYQRDTGGDHWQLVTRIAQDAPVPVPGVSGGCNALAAGNGRWMRRLDGARPVLSGSQDWQPSTGRVGDISATEDIAVVLDNEMRVLSVYEAGVHVRDIPRGVPFGGVRVIGHVASWLEFPGPTVRACDLRTGEAITVAVLGPAQYTPLVFRSAGASGRLWVAYQTDADGGLVHPCDDPSSGYRFGSPKSIYDPDVRLDAQDGMVLCWSLDESQFRQAFLRVDTLGQGMQPLELHAVPSLPPLGRPCWLIPFWATRSITLEDGQRQTVSLGVPGHAEVVSNGSDARLRSVRRPVVCGPAEESMADDILAVWSDLQSADYAQSVAMARRLNVPLIAYHDRHTPYSQEAAASLEPHDWIGVMCYCDPGESQDAFSSRVRASVRHAVSLGHPVALVVQMFDRNGQERDLGKVSRIQGLWHALASEHPEVVAIMPFAVLRDGGVRTHQFLAEWLDAYGRAMPDAPQRQTVSQPPAPPPVPSAPPQPPSPPPAPPAIPTVPAPTGLSALAAAAVRAATEMVEDAYGDLLGRAPDPEGLQFYVSAMRSGRMDRTAMREHIMASPEYVARRQGVRRGISLGGLE